MGCVTVVSTVLLSSSLLPISLLLCFPARLLQELSVSPAGEVTLRALGGRCALELLWAPRHRSPPFSAQLRAECMGVVRLLLTARGSCQVNVSNESIHSFMFFFNHIFESYSIICLSVYYIFYVVNSVKRHIFRPSAVENLQRLAFKM